MANTPVAAIPATARLRRARSGRRSLHREGRPAESSDTDPQVALLLARVSEYMAAYVRDFGNVVAEEDYRHGCSGRPRTRWHLKSDLLLGSLATRSVDAKYDVFEVTGRPVARPRRAGAEAVPREPGRRDAPWRSEDSNEGARYNVGTLFRNNPTRRRLPRLEKKYLSPKRIGGISFWSDGEETSKGSGRSGSRSRRWPDRRWCSPTTPGPMCRPTASSGWISIDRADSQDAHLADSGPLGDDDDGLLQAGQSLGLWVPAVMNERYNTPTEEIDGRAVYKNFRSFNVTTETKIK